MRPQIHADDKKSPALLGPGSFLLIRLVFHPPAVYGMVGTKGVAQDWGQSSEKADD